MKRECTRCGRMFTPQDLCRADSRGMEAERKAAGLDGFRFLHYQCPACSMSDIFVDMLPLDGESPEDFDRRRAEMEGIARGAHEEQAEAVVVVRA
jgi:hypothetical protein